MTGPTLLREPGSDVKSRVISIGVSIWRWIFKRYFTPTAFARFDRDHEIDDIIAWLFWEYPEALAILDQKWPELETKITKTNVLNLLIGQPKVDFEKFIADELWWKDSDAYKMFEVFLKRIEDFEQEDKERVLKSIEDWDQVSKNDYLFLLELIARKRIKWIREFQKIYKFMRDTQFEERLIMASLKSMENVHYRIGLIWLIKERWSKKAKKALPWFK